MFNSLAAKATMFYLDNKNKDKDDIADLPEITPDFGFPGATGLISIAGYVLGAALVLLFIAVVVSGAMIAFKGFGNQQAQQGGFKVFGWALFALAVVGSISAIWKWAMKFDLGFF